MHSLPFVFFPQNVRPKYPILPLSVFPSSSKEWSSTHPSQTLDLPFIDDMDIFIEDLATAWFVITVIDGFAPMGR